MREPLITKYREAIKDCGNIDELVPEMNKGGLSASDIRYIIKSSGDTPKPHKLKAFGKD